VTPRQAYAIAHPLSRADGALSARYFAERQHKTGVLLRTALAVDR
jgi:hypothetical protein